jgi:Acyl-coenzyme A:6-aminopenicillanic acid acyl-transferase
MSASVTATSIGDIPWLVASGERQQVFRALGEHSRRSICRLIEELPELPALRGRVAGPSSEHFAAIAGASRRRYPVEWREIGALAEGAGVDAADLLLLALRGDLGPRDDKGCSDFGWTDGCRAVLGHNEDGDPVLHGLCSLLTLRLDGEPAVVTWWYPGFLPGNTYTVNEHGLVWGVDAVHSRSPAVAPGRAFVARALQRSRSLDHMAGYLREHPAAGAFAYVAGALGSPRLLTLEQAGRHVASFEAGAGSLCTWHTNHLRYLPASLNAASADSLSRGAVLSSVSPPARNATVGWILDVLAGSPVPEGVRAEGSALTLCTFVADLQPGTLTLVPHRGAAATVPVADLVRGELAAASATTGRPGGSHDV